MLWSPHKERGKPRKNLCKDFTIGVAYGHCQSSKKDQEAFREMQVHLDRYQEHLDTMREIADRYDPLSQQ